MRRRIAQTATALRISSPAARVLRRENGQAKVIDSPAGHHMEKMLERRSAAAPQLGTS